MKCPYCGAEVKGDVCEYCGSHIERDKKGCCPQCGSKKISYSRERRSQNLTETVAFCADCGYSWVAGNNALFEMKPTTMLWVFGWVFCFPVPVTVLLWRAESVPQKLKYVLITLLWLGYSIVFIFPWILPWIAWFF